MFQQISKLSHIGKVFEPLCVNFRSLVPVSFFPFLSMLLNVNRPSLSFRTNLPMWKVKVRVGERKVKVKILTSASPSVGSISGFAKISNLIVMKKSSSSASPPEAWVGKRCNQGDSWGLSNLHAVFKKMVLHHSWHHIHAPLWISMDSSPVPNNNKISFRSIKTVKPPT